MRAAIRDVRSGSVIRMMLTRGQIRAQREAHDWLDAATGRQKLLDRTRDGDEVLEFLVAVMRGARFRWPQLHPQETLMFRPTSEQRVRTAVALAERLWGRAANPTAQESASVDRGAAGRAALATPRRPGCGTCSTCSRIGRAARAPTPVAPPTTSINPNGAFRVEAP